MSRQHEQPFYNRHTVATTLGWVDSRTGEIIVSYKGLEDAINLHGIARRDIVKVIQKSLKEKEDKVEKIEEPKQEEQVVEKIEEPKQEEEVVEEIEEPKQEEKVEVIEKETTEAPKVKKEKASKPKATKKTSTK